MLAIDIKGVVPSSSNALTFAPSSRARSKSPSFPSSIALNNFVVDCPEVV
uniref:Uncharacterized protein n=1 Tax=Wolbachia endosymbiont of Aleurodicus floccissimus TaxID=2152762 RepID=A0A3B0IY30_9RICK